MLDSDCARITTELLSRIREGDRHAWEELYHRYHDELLLAVRCRLGRKLRNHLQSEDILQSVMLEAVKDLPRFEPRHDDALKHFLNVMITNKIRDRADTFGAQKRSGGVPLSDELLATCAAPDAGTLSPRYFERERYEQLELLLDKLPEEMRDVVLLRKIEGLSSKEAAQSLGKSDAAVRKLFSRGMARLTRLAQRPK